MQVEQSFGIVFFKKSKKKLWKGQKLSKRNAQGITAIITILLLLRGNFRGARV